MEMDGAVGTTTHILSAIIHMPTPTRVGPSHSAERALDRKSTLVANKQPGSSIMRTSLRHPTAQKLPDYIGVILHCKGVSRPMIRCAHTSLLALIPTISTIASS